MQFNVLNDRWITVKTHDGSIQKTGILDCLQNAHKYLEIADNSMMHEFGIYRLLQVFLMDAFTPESVADIKAILNKGTFDMEKIEKYLSQCRADGVSFDLFDESRPFLQVRRGEWKATDAFHSVARLDFTKPTGNNHTFFNTVFEDEQEMSPADCAKGLVSVNLFCTAMLQGYPSTVSGAPPIYYLVLGDNLFETLALNMVPIDYAGTEGDLNGYNLPPALWRNAEYIEPKAEVSKSSLLRGMLFPCRRVLLRPDGEENIKNIFFSQGLNFTGYESFTDPNVSYYMGKNGRGNVKPVLEKESWRDLGTILDKCSFSAPLVVRQFGELFEDRNITVATYEVVTSNASYLDCSKGGISLPPEIFNELERFKLLAEIIDEVEYNGAVLKRNINWLRERIGYGKRSSADKKGPQSLAADRDYTVSSYYSEAKTLVLGMIVPDFEEASQEELEDLKKDWTEQLWYLCMNKYEEFVNAAGSTGRILTESEQVKSYMWELHRERGEDVND